MSLDSIIKTVTTAGKDITSTAVETITKLNEDIRQWRINFHLLEVDRLHAKQAEAMKRATSETKEDCE